MHRHKNIKRTKKNIIILSPNRSAIPAFDNLAVSKLNIVLSRKDILWIYLLKCIMVDKNKTLVS